MGPFEATVPMESVSRTPTNSQPFGTTIRSQDRRFLRMVRDYRLIFYTLSVGPV
jgi:hypothetical protein